MSIVDAAVEAARIRLRPILMTSFAFILGVLPLALATGAGAGARNSVGTAVAGGMLASTFLSDHLHSRCSTSSSGRWCRARCAAAMSRVGALRAEAPATAAVVLAIALGARRYALASPSRLSAAYRARSTRPGGADRTHRAGARRSHVRADAGAAMSPSIRPSRAAVEQNPTIQIAATNVLRAEALLQQVRATTLPFVNASASTRRSTPPRGFDGNVVQPQNQSTLARERRDAGPGRGPLGRRGRSRRIAIEVARLNTADVRRQIAVSAAIAYLSVITQGASSKCRNARSRPPRAQLDYNQKRLEGGVGSRLNALRASADRVRR